MFGDDQAIQSAAPAYAFDCLLRRESIDRYDDRNQIRTNLIDAYDQMMTFVEKHLNDPFYLEGTQRISLRDKVFREAISNIISHREYLHGSPARLMIYKDKVILDNPCVSHYMGEITTENLVPYARNPVICQFMMQLGRFDRLGSGVININKYLPLYVKGAKPIFKENDNGFELTIPLVSLADKDIEAQVKAQVKAQVEAQVVFSVLKACRMKQLSSADIVKALGHKTLSGNLRRLLPVLREDGLIAYTVPDKPRSRNQKYRLTEKGREYLENNE